MTTNTWYQTKLVKSDMDRMANPALKLPRKRLVDRSFSTMRTTEIIFHGSIESSAHFTGCR